MARRTAVAVISACMVLAVSPLGAGAQGQANGDEDVTFDIDVDSVRVTAVPDGPDTITFRGVDKYASVDASAESVPIADVVTVMNADADGPVDLIIFPTEPVAGDDVFQARVTNARSDDGDITADVEILGDDGAPLPDDTAIEGVEEAIVTATVDDPTLPAPDDGAPLGSTVEGSPVTVILRSDDFEAGTPVELTPTPPSCILSPSTDKITLDDPPSTDPWTFTYADTPTCTRGSYQIVYGKRDVIVSFAFDGIGGVFGIISKGCTSNAKCSVRGGINKITIDVTKK